MESAVTGDGLQGLLQSCAYTAGCGVVINCARLGFQGLELLQTGHRSFPMRGEPADSPRGTGTEPLLAAAYDGESRTLEAPLEFGSGLARCGFVSPTGSQGASPAFRQAPLSVSTLSGVPLVRGRPFGIVAGPA
jgi:hypothetical protein